MTQEIHAQNMSNMWNSAATTGSVYWKNKKLLIKVPSMFKCLPPNIKHPETVA